ncbi:general secretion pathway protein M [Candidatus Magnetobacterium bavaricum]|uniref:General secretion pathway protein M n=1 Tax=Candidatus Magnetobacterium bavaricum TaxID=29290 RepID=A0A0F3GSP7_9BACT|nr:general secretion pathway protein M [Candidatus Magnetobacterium bavaricum]
MSRKKLITLVLIMLLLGIGVIYDSVYRVAQERRDDVADRKALKIKKLKDYKAAVAQKDTLEEVHQEYKKNIDQITNYVIHGKTPALAAADLQSIIQSTITPRGGNITRFNVKPPENTPPFQVINVEMDVTCPNISVLNDILYELETRKPFLYLKKLDIRPVNLILPIDLIVNFEISALTM